MLEVVRNYDVDGVHFDYIRYPNKDGCFCAGCLHELVGAPESVGVEGCFSHRYLKPGRKR